jgi:CBS domain-containing protein
MNLEHEGQVVDVLEPGECFGHPSLLSGMAPAFTVRAREDSTCVAIPRDAALRAFGRPAGARFVALSLRERLVRTGQVVHALPQLSATRLGALVKRPPLVLEPGCTIRQAARAITDRAVAAALVLRGAEVGIVTDADLRERALAEGRPSDAPVSGVARFPAPSARADRTAGETLVDLLDQKVHEVCVTGPDGAILGVVTVDDLAGGERSPFALRRAFERAVHEDGVVHEARAGLPRLLAGLLSAGLAPADVCRVLTIQADAATVRLIDFAMATHGQAPVAWAWIGLGSVGRRELTLASDQDNALGYADGADPATDEYFGRVAADVNRGLERCGFGADRAEVLARNAAWRMPATGWRTVFEHCLEHPDHSGLVRAAVSFDFRHVAGGLEIGAPLTAVMREAPAHPDFLRRLARTVTDLKVPLTRRGALDTSKDGTLDLKLGGSLPIANLARLHALAGGITVSSTVDRLDAARRTGGLEAGIATELLEAFDVVTRIRLEHHARCLREERPTDNLVDVGALPPLRRASLREALKAIASTQKRLGVYAPMGL